MDGSLDFFDAVVYILRPTALHFIKLEAFLLDDTLGFENFVALVIFLCLLID